MFNSDVLYFVDPKKLYYLSIADGIVGPLGNTLDLTMNTVPYDPFPSSLTISKSFMELPRGHFFLSTSARPCLSYCSYYIVGWLGSFIFVYKFILYSLVILLSN